MTCKTIGNTDEVLVLLDVRFTEDVAGSNKNTIKEAVKMVRKKEEVEHIWTEAEEVVEPVNLTLVWIDDSMGSVDDSVVFSDVKVDEYVLGSIRNEVKK